MTQRGSDSPGTIFTVGHSTRSLEALVELLKAFKVRTLVDVRTIPRSRHNPQFNADTLARDLETASVSYILMKDLGGLRHALAHSPNTGWRNKSFRGFADYMQTREFREALDHLIEIARTQTVALMCAEAVPWRCHRSLIADALTIRGINVEHIMSLHRSQVHVLSPMAVTQGTEIVYPNGHAGI